MVRKNTGNLVVFLPSKQKKKLDCNLLMWLTHWVVDFKFTSRCSCGQCHVWIQADSNFKRQLALSIIQVSGGQQTKAWGFAVLVKKLN